MCFLYLDANYRLCVISGRDKRNRSCSVMSFLDKYQRQTPPLRMNQIRAYVARKLVSGVEDDDRIAAVVDVERLSLFITLNV